MNTDLEKDSYFLTRKAEKNSTFATNCYNCFFGNVFTSYWLE